MHAIGTKRDDVADLARLDALVEGLAGLAVPPHQAHADLEILLDRFLRQFQHPTRCRAVHRDRLLHEDIDALVNGIGEVDPAEGRRRGKNHDVARCQAIDGLLVAVEPDELAIVGDVDLVTKLRLQVTEAAGQPVARTRPPWPPAWPVRPWPSGHWQRLPSRVRHTLPARCGSCYSRPHARGAAPTGKRRHRRDRASALEEGATGREAIVAFVHGRRAPKRSLVRHQRQDVTQ